jgi:hypothetical protein
MFQHLKPGSVRLRMAVWSTRTVTWGCGGGGGGGQSAALTHPDTAPLR